jgi:hypothetical protein
MFTFLRLDGQQRVFQVRFGLAKKESTYFIVLMLQVPTTPQTCNPLMFPREPYSQDSQYKYQQQTHPPSQATSPYVALPFFPYTRPTLSFCHLYEIMNIKVP